MSGYSTQIISPGGSSLSGGCALPPSRCYSPRPPQQYDMRGYDMNSSFPGRHVVDYDRPSVSPGPHIRRGHSPFSRTASPFSDYNRDSLNRRDSRASSPTSRRRFDDDYAHLSESRSRHGSIGSNASSAFGTREITPEGYRSQRTRQDSFDRYDPPVFSRPPSPGGAFSSIPAGFDSRSSRYAYDESYERNSRRDALPPGYQPSSPPSHRGYPYSPEEVGRGSISRSPYGPQWVGRTSTTRYAFYADDIGRFSRSGSRQDSRSSSRSRRVIW